MKYKLFILFIFILCLCALNASLVDIYKKGVIKLIPDPDFGKGTDWESLFYDPYKDILVTPDGNIFISNNRLHNIFKFNPEGKKTGVYSRSGLGPGDTNYPSLTSMLDGKYLVVGEYASDHKVSAFDFSGKCAAALRTKNYCFSPVGLKNGCIAYYSTIYQPEKRKGIHPINYMINIINMNSKNELQFPFVSHESRVIPVSSSSCFGIGSIIGDIFLKKTKDGNLMLSISNTPDIFIYSPEGKLISRFRLNVKPFPVTTGYIEKVKELTLDDERLKKNPIIYKAVKNFDFRSLFNNDLPYYKDIIVDSEGNFLVFKWTDSFDDSKEIFRVYSPEGKYICETILEKGNYGLDIDPRFNHIQFTSTGIYAYVSYEGEDDTNFKIIKVKW